MLLDGRNLAVDDYGEGEVLLCVHGLGGTSNFWRPVAAAFSGDYRVIAVDLPSAGRSDIDPDLSIQSLCTDLFSVLDEIDIRSVGLVGHSLGTIICQHMAVIAPDRVRDMVLLGPLAAPPEAARDAIAQRADAARRDGMDGIADAIADVALAAETKVSNPNAQGFVREMLMRQSAEGYALSCLALSEAQAADASSIACSVLLITGDQDGVAPAANVSLLHEALPHSHMHELEHCGHWTLTERDREVIRLMQEFYK